MLLHFIFFFLSQFHIRNLTPFLMQRQLTSCFAIYFHIYWVFIFISKFVVIVAKIDMNAKKKKKKH